MLHLVESGHAGALVRSGGSTILLLVRACAAGEPASAAGSQISPLKKAEQWKGKRETGHGQFVLLHTFVSRVKLYTYHGYNPKIHLPREPCIACNSHASWDCCVRWWQVFAQSMPSGERLTQACKHTQACHVCGLSNSTVMIKRLQQANPGSALCNIPPAFLPSAPQLTPPPPPPVSLRHRQHHYKRKCKRDRPTQDT